MARRSTVQHRKLSRLLRRAPEEIQETVKEVIAEASQELLLEAEAEIPVDSGLARDVMAAKASRSGLSAQVGFLNATSRRKAFYAAFVHFGTRGAPEKNIPAMQPKPFLFGPAERLRLKFIKQIDAVVNSALQKLSRGS